MYKCQKCGAPIPYRKVIDGQSRCLYGRKYCLDCIPFKSGTRRGRPRKPERSLTCSSCGRVYVYSARVGHSLDECNTCRVKRYRLAVKAKAVEYKGGKCEICGYSRCIRALEFHHRDPSQKDFTISYWARALSWEAVKVEVDKCALLCANCHREVEAGLVKLPGVA